MNLIRSYYDLVLPLGEEDHGHMVDKMLALEGRVEHWTREICKVDVWHHSVKLDFLIFVAFRLAHHAKHFVTI